MSKAPRFRKERLLAVRDGRVKIERRVPPVLGQPYNLAGVLDAPERPLARRNPPRCRDEAVAGPDPWPDAARAVVAGALYPRLVMIEKPSQKYAATSEGNIAMDAQARELRFLRRTPTGQLERAFLHPTSSCYAERSWPSPWAVYGECVETHRVSIRDCGEAAPYAV